MRVELKRSAEGADALQHARQSAAELVAGDKADAVVGDLDHQRIEGDARLDAVLLA